MSLETALVLIVLLPLAGFLVNGLLGRRLGKRAAAIVACAGPLIAFVLSWRIFRFVSGEGAPEVEALLYTWIGAGELQIEMKLVADRLTAIMLLVVTGVGSLIHIYSAEYMEGEDAGGYARYFSYLNLFTAMMLVLVTAASLPLLFVGWEGVGLCSYLLIGFWYRDMKNVSAGRKAFIVNRVGDFAFLLGIFLIWVTPGLGELSFAGLAELDAESVDVAMTTTACLLLFIGAAGKSAQIPLYVWLPDAMAGPTPVSALIHAATMVTAGVYMIARLGELYALAPIALGVVAAVGVATALYAATMALAERDLKKILAYSTISQLGFMFVGVGTGVYAAGIFHLVTHAFFKALLFLGAGAVMHAVHHMDITRMGGLRQKMPYTFWLFLIGALGLAGLPPFSGFFSKDEVLGMTFQRFVMGDGVGWLLIWLAGVLTAGLTAFYTFRAVALTFLGESRAPVDEHVHAHDPGRRMLVPLLVLGALAAVAGFFNIPHALGGQTAFFGYMEPVLGYAPHEAGRGAMLFAMAVTTALAALAAYAAYWIYTKRPGLPGELLARPAARKAYEVARDKYYIDEVYDRYITRPVSEGAHALWRWVDVAVIDNAVNRLAHGVRAAAEEARTIQTGYLHRYAVYVAGGTVALLLVLLLRA